MGADAALSSLNWDFPIPNNKCSCYKAVLQTPQHYPHAPILHSFQPRVLVLLESRWLWHLSAEIPTAGLKCSKSWIELLLEISIIMFSLRFPNRPGAWEKEQNYWLLTGWRQFKFCRIQNSGEFGGKKKEKTNSIHMQKLWEQHSGMTNKP